MTVLAMRLSAGRNAVSRLHREVTGQMWSYLLPKGARITHITNGVHTWSWLAPELAELFDEYTAGRAWREAVEDPGAWSFIYEVPPEALWETHQKVKRRMASFASRRGVRGGELDPEALTIGFARRFATYKRATLLLSDPERLRRMTGDGERPVQFVFAGKAHPADTPAKSFIQELYRAAEEEFAGRLFILEDYDMNLARHLVQGADVWLNNPRRPLEASGTSGQKAALNGAPNFSVLDGWWPEAYNGHNGWAIGSEKEYGSTEEQDAADADSLYQTLEESLIPLYYDRDAAGVPEGWVRVMKESISTIAPSFSTQRMVRDYVHRLYAPRAPPGSPRRGRRCPLLRLPRECGCYPEVERCSW
jgi:starch phosphorylase